VELTAFIPGEIEKWLRGLKKKPRCERKGALPEGEAEKLKPLAPGTKVKIRNLMSVLFNHAIRWSIFATNPIAGPARKAGVRQSGKRQEAPDILELAEMQSILSELSVREDALISLDMITGLRRGELAGLKWGDIDFENLLVNVVRSVVNQRTGRCKTEASAKPEPIDEYTAEVLLKWYRLTPFREPGDWVFATNSARAGKKRGKQPLWLSKVMQYHIQPLVKRLGINKRVSWHTFRRTFTSLLTANRENVKVVQELLRQASSKITMDTYAQANMKDKRKAQLRIVKGLRKPLNETKGPVANNVKTGGRLARKLA
jgi:integrase